MPDPYPSLGLPCLDESRPAVCRSCQAGAEKLIRGLVSDFDALSAEIGRRERPVEPGPGGKPGSSPPINVHIDALRAGIVHSAAIWEEIIRDHCGLSSRRRGAMRERSSLVNSVRILAPRTDVFFALSSTDGRDGLRGLGRLHLAVERALGTGALVVRLPADCSCGARGSLRREVGSEVVGCEDCRGVWTYGDYQRYVQFLIETLP